MNDSEDIVPGSAVTLHLKIELEDGTEALSTFGEEPLALTVGDGTLQPGLELALYGLKVGDRQTVRLDPGQAYGPHDPARVQRMPLGDFAGGPNPERGQVIAFGLPNGDQTAGLVLAVDGDEVEVDFNHPLAGHEITLSVEVLEVGETEVDSEAR